MTDGVSSPDAGPRDAGVGEPCAGPGPNPPPGPGVQWEMTPSQDAGLWVGPIAGPYSDEDLVFISEADLLTHWRDWADAIASVTPGVGTVKDVVEAVTGHNFITGEDLTTSERLLAVVGVLGALGEAAQQVARASAAVDDAADAARAADSLREASLDRVADAADAAERATALRDLQESTLTFLEALDVSREAVRAAESSPAGRLGELMSGIGKIDDFSDWVGLASEVAQALAPEAPDQDPGTPPSDGDGGSQEDAGAPQDADTEDTMQLPNGAELHWSADGSVEFTAPDGTTVHAHANGPVVATWEAVPEAGASFTTAGGYTVTVAGPGGGLVVESDDGATWSMHPDGAVAVGGTGVDFDELPDGPAGGADGAEFNELPDQGQQPDSADREAEETVGAEGG